MLDGTLQRKYNLVSDLGKFLDPIADKLLVKSALLLVVCDGTIAAPYAVCSDNYNRKELIKSAFRQIAATKNFVMAADFWGKIKTFVTDISFTSTFLIKFLLYNGSIAGTSFLTDFEILNYILLRFP